jgi:hypothetical protein
MKEIKDTNTEAHQSLLSNDSSVDRILWYLKNYKENPLYNEDLD